VGTIFSDYFYAMTGVDVISLDPGGSVQSKSSERVALATQFLMLDDPLRDRLQAYAASSRPRPTAYVLFHSFRDPLNVLNSVEGLRYNHFCSLVPRYAVPMTGCKPNSDVMDLDAAEPESHIEESNSFPKRKSNISMVSHSFHFALQVGSRKCDASIKKSGGKGGRTGTLF
jgi:hypothetical protein